MDHAAFVIGLNGKAGAPGSEMPCCILLPPVMLTSDLADFDAAMAFVDCTEGGSRFDGLELLRVTTYYVYRSSQSRHWSNLVILDSSGCRTKRRGSTRNRRQL
jgi:hypothetical protein